MERKPLKKSHGEPLSFDTAQSGVVLIISLIMLMLLTLIGVTAMQTSAMEERMSGNSRDEKLAFQSAEAALRAGEARIETLWNAGNGSLQQFCNAGAAGNGLFTTVANCPGGAAKPPPNSSDADTWNNNGKSVVSNDGRYFITYINAYNAGPPVIPVMFMITAKGAGKIPGTQVVLRSYYGGDTAWLP